jgi:hypothetical protein
MKPTRCPKCGEALALWAPACGHCGAPNRTRLGILIAGAVLVALSVAVVVAILPGVRPATAPTTADKPAGADKDFGWLSAALDQCDKDAANEPNAIHFIVTPLVDAAKDEPGWRRISLNDIGNAILIKAEDMLAGLKRGALRISPDEYIFAIRNEANNVVYKWSPSAGVKRFSSPKAEAIEIFRIQFQNPAGTGGLEWGAIFTRRPGNCYWVNAIVLLQRP